ncbi:MAG TPA: polyprenyl diphosphate synthase [Nevskiaceae bacterium]|nr:polyprenyl diphosphate synthase [Nevskiaceae bacterium]
MESNWQDIPELEVPEGKLQHLAVICDGNRRAAQERNLNSYFGHRAGVEVIRGVARACRQWQIHTLTFWTWSTENWKRDRKQIGYVMDLAARFLSDSELKGELVDNEVRFKHLGRKDRLPPGVKQALDDLERETRSFDRYRLNLAMDYGGADELARAAVELHYLMRDGRLKPEELLKDSSLILNCLDTRGQPNPALVIRTGVKEGEIPHTSGFMPLQSGYACWEFVPDLFPNLTPQRLLESANNFIEYERRFGR